jgi:hypothetical protein
MAPWSFAWQIRMNPCTEKPLEVSAMPACRFARREESFEHVGAPILMLCKHNDKLRAHIESMGLLRAIPSI